MRTIFPPQALVLNVDSNAVNRDLKTQSLLTGDIKVIEAATGTAALTLITQRHPLLVLLEGNFCKVDDLALGCRIKTDWPEIIVIQIATAEEIIGLGDSADCYLTTPVEPTELIAVTKAMLQLQRAEAQAQESGERYQTIVENAADCAIFTCDLDGRITTWNSGAQATLGYTPEEMIGEAYARIFTTEDASTDVPAAEMRAAHSSVAVHAERWHRRRDGTRFWSTGRLMSLRNRRNEVTGYLKILYDRSIDKAARDALNDDLEDRVAERTRDLTVANEKLQAEIVQQARAGEQLRQLQKMEALGELTGGIAHDFNNLLTAILGGLEVTRRRTDNPRSLRLIDSSISAARRGAKIITQLTAFARRQNLHAEHLLLNTLVQEMHELLEQTVGTAVNVVYDLAPDAWPVMADATHVRAAILNLAINASDAMPNGGTCRIISRNMHLQDVEVDQPAGDYATIAVQDNGIGMAKDVQARLFEPFFTTKDFGKGTGLGLAQVYGFVRQSGGTVRVNSELDEGTTITILLPRAVAPQLQTTVQGNLDAGS